MSSAWRPALPEPSTLLSISVALGESFKGYRGSHLLFVLRGRAPRKKISTDNKRLVGFVSQKTSWLVRAGKGALRLFAPEQRKGGGRQLGILPMYHIVGLPQCSTLD